MVSTHELLGSPTRMESILPRLPVSIVRPILERNNSLVTLMPDERLDELGRLGRAEMIRRRIDSLYKKIGTGDRILGNTEPRSFDLSKGVSWQGNDLPYPVLNLLREYLRLDGEEARIKIDTFVGVVNRKREAQLRIIVWRGDYQPSVVLQVSSRLDRGGVFGINIPEHDGRLPEHYGALPGFMGYQSILEQPMSESIRCQDCLQIVNFALACYTILACKK